MMAQNVIEISNDATGSTEVGNAVFSNNTTLQFSRKLLEKPILCQQ